MSVSADPAPDSSPTGPPAHDPPVGTLAHLIDGRLAGSDLDEDTRALLRTAFQDDGPARGRMPGAYLQSVTVSGFRGIGRTARLPLTPGPGLTLVTGRNGSGKSSFAEAVEIALTGDNARWRGRSDIWRKSWRNLHHGQEPQVAVELRIDGDPEPATVLRTWHGDDVADSTAELDRPGHDPVPLQDLGWQEDLATYRPFLSYSELGQVIGGKPSEMYDAVASILGLEQLAAADKRLRELAREYEAPAKAAKAELPALLALLDGTDDPRARAAHTALSGRRPDLARAAELAAGTGAADESLLFDLRRRSTLAGPDTEAVATAVTRLREAIAWAEDLRGTSAEDALRRAELLARALAHHRAHPAIGTCPVCGGTARLDEEWARDATEQERRLRSEAEQILTARGELDAAAQAVRDLAVPPPDWLPSEIAAAWDDWLRCRTVSDPAVLASVSENAARTAADAARVTRHEAAGRLADQDDTWRDAARGLAAWLDKAHAAEEAAPHLARVKAAQKWLKATHDEIRADRMLPIAEDAQRIWSHLRQQSNVTLGPVRLSGSATQREVALDVTVDDIDAPALGVMSQGELHALALSLFLPRTFLPENPFRFLVIDDPVQSMDPAKVDGLARVLALLAEQRQVVVFTHDTRLPQALKYLRLPATVHTVDRRERSSVRVRSGDDPVKQALHDAKALARTRDLPGDVVTRVLPGLCRTALEAALLEPARRRLLGTGLSHHEIERRIAKAHKLTELASLALYGESDRVGETMTDLTRAYGQQATDHIRWCNKGSHEAVPIGDVEEIIRRTADLAKAVRSL
ncbi:AAA family ATPase [Streptomyces sp. DH8]|uniref:AAA family ATPase n=1 Tax=Streptomyces sp. DH8 TaxID=2857008 RepID=UPI001E45FBEA|nr:AAA family ATPase [Streptomyces sp. DH8]